MEALDFNCSSNTLLLENCSLSIKTCPVRVQKEKGLGSELSIEKKKHRIQFQLNWTVLKPYFGLHV